MSNQYRKKPVVIEAIKFDGTLASLEAFNIPEVSQDFGSSTAQIYTLEGVMNAEPGDWIIKGVKGEFYPCKPDIFAATYEDVAARELDVEADLLAVADAVVARWNSPKWKDEAPTADYIARLRRAVDAARSAAQSTAPVSTEQAGDAWISVKDRLPGVPLNDNRQFIIACRRGRNGKTYVFAADYLNARELHNDEDGAVALTGWYTESEHPEYNGWFEPVCQAGDEVTHWMPLPAAPSPNNSPVGADKEP